MSFPLSWGGIACVDHFLVIARKTVSFDEAISSLFPEIATSLRSLQ